MRDQLRQSLSLLPRRPESWIWISKPSQSGIKKFVGRRSVAACALSIERPAKYELRRTIVFSSHSSEPMVDKRRLSDTSPGNDGNDIGILVCPGTIQKREVLLSTKQITSGNG